MPCSHEVSPVLSHANRERQGRLEVTDAIAWGRERLVPQLEIRRRLGSVAVHPTWRVATLVSLPSAPGGELAHDVHALLSPTCCAVGMRLPSPGGAHAGGHLVG